MELNKSLSHDNDYSLEAKELLSSEMEEIEGGTECSCSSCQYICYTSLW